MDKKLDVRTELEFYWKNIEKVPEKTTNSFRVETPKGGKYMGQESMDDTCAFTVYYCWTGIDEALMFLYLGHDTFDKQYALLRNYYSAMAKRFPKFIDAIENGLNDHYSEYALVKIKEKNTEEEPFWCMVNKLENVKELDINNPYIERKHAYLFNACQDVLYEMKTQKLSTWDIIKTNLFAFLGGCAETIKINDTFDQIEKIINIFLPLMF